MLTLMSNAKHVCASFVRHISSFHSKHPVTLKAWITPHNSSQSKSWQLCLCSGCICFMCCLFLSGLHSWAAKVTLHYCFVFFTHLIGIRKDSTLSYSFFPFALWYCFFPFYISKGLHFNESQCWKGKGLYVKVSESETKCFCSSENCWCVTHSSFSTFSDTAFYLTIQSFHLSANLNSSVFFPPQYDLAGQHLIKLHFLSLRFRYYYAAPFKR